MMKVLTLVLLFGVGAAITSLRAGGTSAKKVLAVGVERKVTLEGGKSLGIKFEKASSGHGPMKVTGIDPKGQANTTVFVGDTVVAINGKPVLELTYADATKISRQALDRAIDQNLGAESRQRRMQGPVDRRKRSSHPVRQSWC